MKDKTVQSSRQSQQAIAGSNKSASKSSAQAQAKASKPQAQVSKPQAQVSNPKSKVSISDPNKAKAPAYVKAAPPSKDKLDKIREGVKAIRDLQLAIVDKKNEVTELNQSLTTLSRNTIPDLFAASGITNIGIDPEGNMPGYEAESLPYYKAGIAASWPPEKKEVAFDYLIANGGGNLIQTTITVDLPVKSIKLRKQVEAALRKLKVDFMVEPSVHWASLTSFVREKIEREKVMPPLDVLGADVGRVVKLKVKKES